MTYREFYEAVVTGVVTEEMKDFAAQATAKLDERNAKRSATPTKKQKENEAIKAQIVEVLTAEPMTSAAIAEAVGISTAKAAALCKQIVTEGYGVSTMPIKTDKGFKTGFAIQ